MSTAAFASPFPLRVSSFSLPHCHAVPALRAPLKAPFFRRAPRMQDAQDPPLETPPVPAPAPSIPSASTPSSSASDEEDAPQQDAPTTSAKDILRTLREEAAADDSPVKRSMLGVYRDVDGKSNVWAVEPQEETDTKPQISGTTLIVVAAAFIVVALLVLPLLPFTNPDQI